MNSFICTGKGFIKSFNLKKNNIPVIEYTEYIRDAKLYNSKDALKIINNPDANIIGFIYQPWKEEPIRDMYDVGLEISYNYNDSQIYEIKRGVMKYETDANFLKTKQKVINSLYTLEEAKEKIKKLNNNILENIKQKIAKCE